MIDFVFYVFIFYFICVHNRVFEAQGMLLMYSAVENRSYSITRFAVKNTDTHTGAKIIKVSYCKL